SSQRSGCTGEAFAAQRQGKHPAVDVSPPSIRRLVDECFAARTSRFICGVRRRQHSRFDGDAYPVFRFCALATEKAGKWRIRKLAQLLAATVKRPGSYH